METSRILFQTNKINKIRNHEKSKIREFGILKNSKTGNFYDSKFWIILNSEIWNLLRSKIRIQIFWNSKIFNFKFMNSNDKKIQISFSNGE